MGACKVRIHGRWSFGQEEREPDGRKHREGCTSGPRETELTWSSQGCVFLTAFVFPWNDDGVCYNNAGSETGCRCSKRKVESE